MEPPKVPKYVRKGENNTVALVKRQFEIDYYLTRTGDWGTIKFATAVRILRVCILLASNIPATLYRHEVLIQHFLGLL